MENLPPAEKFPAGPRGASCIADRMEQRAASRLQGAAPAPGAPASPETGFWSVDAATLIEGLSSSKEGLSSNDAAARLKRYGPNQIHGHEQVTRLRVIAAQLRSPLLLLLVFAALTSIATGEWVDAAIVLAIVLASTWIGYSREYAAQTTIAALRARVRTHATALRNGFPSPVPIEEIVPGDVVVLSAGSLVPGDGVVLEATDLFVSESALTGESYPVEKAPGTTAAETALSHRTNAVFLGTNVRSGTARCLIVGTGIHTEFGRVAARLSLAPPDTHFERGIRRFGYLLTTAMLVLIVVVFTAHVLRGRPPVETLLFAVALAVGLSPELLPAILTINLTRGARAMSQHGVLVRRLSAIENLGSMDVLCTDKTGTLTEGVVRLEGAYAPDGTASRDVLELAALNAALETGLSNLLDDAILQARDMGDTRPPKLAEIPFDAVRKRTSVVIPTEEGARLITKGAFGPVLDACANVAGGAALDDGTRATLTARADDWSSHGIRVLAVATRALPLRDRYTRADESTLEFAGFLTFLDRPKADVARTIAELARLGVAVKLITGDNALVARHVAGLVELRAASLLTGSDLRRLPDEALWAVVDRTDVFAEVDPNQKERIITALRKRGHVVGFLGDGVNDAPAMHAADTSLAVDQAVDVARAVADFVLLERDLDVIRRGIEEGRRTFANTMKYVLTTTSANLGNMISMAAASLFLPFLPLLAGQILLNNFLSDIPAVGIADDSVDAELVARPERWNMGFIARFMVEFGLLSSLFDVLTFVVLLVGFAATPVAFRTAWFIESLLTELLIALVVRTRRPLFRSRPGTVLLVTTVVLVPFAFAIPFLPYAGLLGFAPISISMCAALVCITVLYVAAAEASKRYLLGPPLVVNLAGGTRA